MPQWLESVARDISYGVRGLLRNPVSLPGSTDPVRRPGGGDLGGGTSTLHTVTRMTAG